MHRLTALVAGILLVAALPGIASAGDFQDEVDEMLGDMTNATDPGAWESTRRGTISGGSIVNRSRIMRPNVVSFRPPDIEAGCGGIDLFGGSFSFINEQQLVQLLRSVASNAKGYAFQLALEGMCPECARQIEAFQKKIQRLNEMFRNSCQMAQGLVNDTASAFGQKTQNDASLIGQVSGAGDIFTTRTNADGEAPKEEARQSDPGRYREQITGNLVWRQLTENNVGAWFGSGPSTSLRETILSITGSVVVTPDPPPQGKTRTDTVPGGLVGLDDLLLGGTLEVYDCENTSPDGCTNLGAGSSTRTIQLDGFSQQLRNELLGTATSPGIVRAWSTNQGALSGAQKQFVSALPQGMGAMIQRLARRSGTAAEQFVRQNSDAIALHMAFSLVNEMIAASQQAMMRSDHGWSKRTRRILRNAREAVKVDYDHLTGEHGTPNEVRVHYVRLLDLLEARPTAGKLIATN